MQKNVLFSGLALAGLVVCYFLYSNFFTPQSNTYPAVSPYQLLDADDVQATIKQAVENNDIEMFNREKARIVEFAQAMDLAPESIEFIQSSEADAYLRFHAKRALFDEALINAFLNLETLAEAKQNYPEASNLFEKADNVISQRDKLFNEIVATLQAEGLSEDEAQTAARQLWRERFDRQSVKQFLGQ